MKIYAPFSKEEVINLNKWQTGKITKPLLCINSHPKRRLTAITDGLICPVCGYMIEWCFDYMIDPDAIQKIVIDMKVKKQVDRIINELKKNNNE